MRISDWSSDVCSSDLAPAAVAAAAADHSVAAEAPGARGAGRDRARRGDAGGEIDRCGAAGTDATLAADADAGRRARTVRIGAAVAADARGGRGQVAGVERARCDMDRGAAAATAARSEEHTSELQSLMRISYAVF